MQLGGLAEKGRVETANQSIGTPPAYERDKESMKKKLVTAISVAAAALGTSVALCPSAVADAACPYDMSTAAGQQALTDATVAASNQVRSDEASYGPTGNQALADKDLQIQADNSRLILACSGKASPESSQALANADQIVANDQAAAKQQADEEAAMNAPPPPPFDFGSGPVGMDCAGMNDSIGSAGPLNTIADVASGGLLGRIQAAPLAVCGATNAALGAVGPNDFNQSQTVTGFCDAANSAFNPLSEVDPCGNTPAG
jgi:hypothetical protein